MTGPPDLDEPLQDTPALRIRAIRGACISGSGMDSGASRLPSAADRNDSGGFTMRTIRPPFTASCLATLLASGAGIGTAQTVALDNDDIGGVVRSSAGPEAGVWVIAETDDFDTRFAKIVVTDDQGRYVVPDLPAGNYQVWVRGYGLADSAKVAGRPGQTLNLTASAASSPAAAAAVYPAAYWYSMMKVPG